MNVKPGPFRLTPGVVGMVLGDAANPRGGITEIPIAELALVDRPRRSDDPRLAKANDDEPRWLMERLPHG